MLVCVCVCVCVCKCARAHAHMWVRVCVCVCVCVCATVNILTYFAGKNARGQYIIWSCARDTLRAVLKLLFFKAGSEEFGPTFFFFLQTIFTPSAALSNISALLCFSCLFFFSTFKVKKCFPLLTTPSCFYPCRSPFLTHPFDHLKHQSITTR